MLELRGWRFLAAWMLNLGVGVLALYLALYCLYWVLFRGLLGLLKLLLWTPKWWLDIPLSLYLCAPTAVCLMRAALPV